MFGTKLTCLLTQKKYGKIGALRAAANSFSNYCSKIGCYLRHQMLLYGHFQNHSIITDLILNSPKSRHYNIEDKMSQAKILLFVAQKTSKKYAFLNLAAHQFPLFLNENSSPILWDACFLWRWNFFLTWL